MATKVVLQNEGNYMVAAKPRFVFVETDAAYATIVAAGWLNSVSNQKILPTDIIVVNYASNTRAFFYVSIDSAGVVTMAPISNPGEVSLVGAAISGNLPMFSGTTGDIADSGIAAAAVSTWAGATVIDNLASFNSVSGEIEDSGIVKTDVLQASTLVTDYSQMVSLCDILIASVGTWTRTRVAQGNYVLRHTDADDTSVIGWDITPMIRAASNLGFRLASFDLIYSIGTLALDAHSVVLDKISYANNTAVLVTSVPLTGTLATATQAQPYLSNVAVTTPAFNNTANSKYVLELTVNAGATSVYDLYGLDLNFSKSVA